MRSLLPGKHTRRLILRAGLFVAISTLAASGGIYAWALQSHRAWYRDVENRIVMLADRCPPGISHAQWAYCLHWTWNLHANYGTIGDWNPDDRVSFLNEFDQRLNSDVDLNSIAWIWDEYSQQSPGARHYDEVYRPTDEIHVRDFFTGQESNYNLNWLLERLIEVRGASD